MERKLTAILCADVFGYSRLMGENEEATHRTLTSHRKLIDALIEQHHGRFVNSAGDSVLAEFASVVNAVQCAVEIQTTLKTENAPLSPDRRMEFRIGVNLGDVMVDGEQIYGDGVNVAARLESLADPGSIFISGSVHEQLGNKLALGYQDLGEQTVKNIAKPVRVFRVRLEGGAPTRTTAKAKDRSRRKHWRGGVFSLAGLALIAAVIVFVQHLSLHPPTPSASIPPAQKPRLLSSPAQEKLGFCRTSDGVRIAYAVIGHGPPVIQILGWLFAGNIGGDAPFLDHAFVERVSARHLFVWYDGRNSGLSDRGTQDFSLEGRVRDLEGVADALQLKRFAIYGDSAGGQTAVAYAVKHPERVTRLALYGAYATELATSPKELEAQKAFITVIRNYWGNDQFRGILTSTIMPDASEADKRLLDEMERTSATADDAADFLKEDFTVDVTAIAPKVRAPTLVISRRGDRAAPFERGRELAALIPGARFMAFEGNNHALLPSDPIAVQINGAVEQFLDEDLPKR